MEMVGMSEAERQAYAPVMQQLENMGIPMLNGLLSMPLDEPHEQIQMETARDLFGNLPVGITHFVLHPSIDTAELRSIAPDWQSRVANYNVFMSDELKKLIESEEIKLIGYRSIRAAMRKG
jgi:chitin disaccharide deacetylase